MLEVITIFIVVLFFVHLLIEIPVCIFDLFERDKNEGKSDKKEKHKKNP